MYIVLSLKICWLFHIICIKICKIMKLQKRTCSRSCNKHILYLFQYLHVLIFFFTNKKKILKKIFLFINENSSNCSLFKR